MMVKKKKTVGSLMKGYFISKNHYYSLEVELIYQCMLNAKVNHSTFHLWLIFQVILWKSCNFVCSVLLRQGNLWSQVILYVTPFVLENSDFLGSFLPPCSDEFKKRLFLNTILYYAEHWGSKCLQNNGNCFPVYILLYPIKPESAPL
jgi:hypothetical protein